MVFKAFNRSHSFNIVLGKPSFAMVYSSDPQRTPSSKVAHLMARLEALSVAPPGVLLLCLHTDPSRLCLWIDCVPSTKLIATLEERLNAGFVPLVQAGSVFTPFPNQF